MGILSGIDDFGGRALLQKSTAFTQNACVVGKSSVTRIAHFEQIAPGLTTPVALPRPYRALIRWRLYSYPTQKPAIESTAARSSLIKF